MDDTFNLHQTVIAVQQALFAVICHMVFDFAIHGLVLAAIVATVGFGLKSRSNRFGRPLMNAAKRVAIACLVLAAPGALTLMLQGHLPPTGVYNVSSIGFIIFWSMLTVHFSAEEMNYCFYVKPVENQETASIS